METVRKIEEVLLLRDGSLVKAASKERWSIPPRIIKQTQSRKPLQNFLLRSEVIPDEFIRKAALPRSGKSIDTDALKIVEQFQPSMLNEPQAFDVQRFFECEFYTEFKGWSDYQQLQPEIHGYTNIEELHCVINSQIEETSVQKRFLRSTIAHEVGHYFLHISEFRQRMKLEEISDNVDIEFGTEIPVYADPEWQAWRFAGALLMPEPAVVKALNIGIDNATDLCNTFDVNPAFLNSRLRALKLI